MAELQLNEYVEVNHKKNKDKGQFMQKRKHEPNVESLWELQCIESNPGERENIHYLRHK